MDKTVETKNILDGLDIKLEIKSNIFNFQEEDLFTMGARVNPKRSFLFISKLLGKHLEVHPQIPKLTGYLLANLFYKNETNIFFSDINTIINKIKNIDKEKFDFEDLNYQVSLKEKTLFLGFAETATGLGHAVSAAFDNATYLHTTREDNIDKISTFDFKEEHSHATDHLCYLQDSSMIEESSHIVLIDDEITTGNTSLNLIQSLNSKYPGKKYTILSILDWRNESQIENYKKFEKQKNISISVISLISGEIDIENQRVFEDETIIKDYSPVINNRYTVLFNRFSESIDFTNKYKDVDKRTLFTGRYGLSQSKSNLIEEECKKIGEFLSLTKRGKKTVCIGNSELIYLPSRIASYMGENVYYKSSTRSPIYVSSEKGYPIKDRISYEVEKGIMNYIYNLKDSEFDEVYMIFEGKMNKFLLDKIYRELDSCNIPHVRFVYV